ncbi:hypothetical protein ACCO45_012163 [Purpureocillium lilacinum]|uniref:Uncharacterized protein n=1 Tax=Purpureocillium lilacinum TaxID=33203 RepID=A0ACC4DDH9_PURLI
MPDTLILGRVLIRFCLHCHLHLFRCKMPASSAVGFAGAIPFGLSSTAVAGAISLLLLGCIYKLLRGGRTNGRSDNGQVAEKEEPAPQVVIEPLHDFDWRAVEPKQFRHFKRVYHITMGLQADNASDLITVDRDYLDRVKHRRHLIEKHGSGVHGCLPGGVAAVSELYTFLMSEYLPTRFPSMFGLSNDGKHFTNHVTGKAWPTAPPEDEATALRVLGETVEEDMFLLHETPEGHKSFAFVCCFPSGFDPSAKVGKLLKDIHAPVPSYEKIGASMGALLCQDAGRQEREATQFVLSRRAADAHEAATDAGAALLVQDVLVPVAADQGGRAGRRAGGRGGRAQGGQRAGDVVPRTAATPTRPHAAAALQPLARAPATHDMTQGRPGITRSHVSRHLRPASPTPTAGHQPNRTPHPPPRRPIPLHRLWPSPASLVSFVPARHPASASPLFLLPGSCHRGRASAGSCRPACRISTLSRTRLVSSTRAIQPRCLCVSCQPGPLDQHPSVNRPRDALRRGSGHDNACDHARRWQHLALTPPRTRTPPPSPTPALERPLPTTPSHSPRVAQTASRSLTSRQPAAGYAVRRLPRNPLGSSSPAPRALLHRLRRRELLPVASCPTLQIPSPHCIPRHHERATLIPARRSLARRACALHRDHRRYPRHRRPRDHLAKKVRQGLEASLGGRDLTDQKDAIKRLIEARFDAVSGANVNDAPASSVPDPSPNKRPAANGVSDSAETDPSASPEPAKKKAKRSTPSEDADARLAAALQAQENSLARARSTRGGGDRTKVVKKKKAPRKKSAKKVGEDDDSEVDGSADSAPKRKGGGGFQKPFILSATLSELCGETQVGHPVWSRSSITGVNEPTQLSRPQVVKKLWEHIKANDLQDPKDKRQIRCDDKMQAVFKQARVDMFRMNKEIGHHLYPVGEE